MPRRQHVVMARTNTHVDPECDSIDVNQMPSLPRTRSQATAIKVKNEGDGFTNNEKNLLLDAVKAQLREDDVMAVKKRIKTIDWKLIRIGNRSQKECVAQLNDLIEPIPSFRTLKELVAICKKNRTAAAFENDSVAASEEGSAPQAETNRPSRDVKFNIKSEKENPADPEEGAQRSKSNRKRRNENVAKRPKKIKKEKKNDRVTDTVHLKESGNNHRIQVYSQSTQIQWRTPEDDTGIVI